MKDGLGLILVIGLLSFGTGVYFWEKVDAGMEIRNATGRVLAQKWTAQNAERAFRIFDLTSSEFYESGTTRNLEKHHAAMVELEQEIQALVFLLPREENRQLQLLRELAHEYQKHFVDLVAAYRLRGLKNWGLEGEWRRAMGDVEGYVRGTQNVYAIRELLNLMHHEKDYLLQNEDQYVDAIYDDLEQLGRMMRVHDGSISNTALNALEDYKRMFTNYIMIQQKIGITEETGLQGEMGRAAQAMDPITQDIRERAIQGGEHARKNFVTVLSLIWGAGFALGGLFFYLHARSIANPIIQLKDAALRIGHGELDSRITIKSNDELGVLANAFNQMVMDLSQTQKALRQSEEQSRLIIETANDAFIGMDKDGFITDWNHQAEVTFGWTRQEAIGRPLSHTIIPTPYREAHTSGLGHFLASGESAVLNKRVELTALHRDGREFPVELTVWPIQAGQTYRFNAFVHDITDRKQAEEVVRQSEQRFRTLTTQAPVGIFLTDARGDCLFVNERWCAMAGMTVEEAQGQGWLRAVHPDDREHVFNVWYDAARNRREFACEYCFQPPNGKTSWLFGTAVALQSEEGEIDGYLGTVTDITERKQAGQMKSDFVSFVTHQLRTPLAGIKWLLELAGEEPDVSKDTLSYIQDARESADRLIKLVNDLLDISGLERWKLTIVPKAVHLGDVTQSVLAELHPLIQEKGHRLSFIPTDAVQTVWVDPQLIRQVIMNLVANAATYTPPGGEIIIEMHQEDSAIRWAIKDTGIGIPATALPRLFEKFYRAENALTIETEGTGLGLYLVRLILQQFGGRIWCESEEGKGASFLFTLPRNVP